MQRHIAEQGERNLREQLGELDAKLQAIVKSRNTERRERERVDIGVLGDHVDPLRRVAYIARQFFDCQVLFVSLR